MRYTPLVFILLIVCIPLSILATDNSCAECHEKIVHSQATLIHTRVGEVSCLTCHPAGEKHKETGETEGLLPPEIQTLCLNCHATLTCDSTHCNPESFTCESCHCIHHGQGKTMLKGNATTLCSRCHKEEMAEMNLPNHHPLPEGKMTCVDCHSPHKAFLPSEATGRDVITLCATCHQDKEGPYIFEHPPVVEDCRICHNAHGSVADNLLTQTEPYLCLQCHEFHFHAGKVALDDTEGDVGGVVFSNPYGTEGMRVAFTTKCTQCHSRIHGSDLPSQSTSGQGTALTR